MNTHPLPQVAIGSLGGTIAMMPSGQVSDSIRPSLGATELQATVPGLAGVARILTADICNVASPSLTVTHMLAALEFATTAVSQGAAGVVLTQGTDTLEETAYLLDLLWPHDAPLILTGAMRSMGQVGADGAMNLLDSVITAADPQVQGQGVLVAMGGEIHLARTATKAHSIAIAAFASPDSGPIGSVREGRLHLTLRPTTRYPALPIPTVTRILVPLIETPVGDEGHLLRAALTTSPAAIVLAAAGAGHIPEVMLPACDEVIAAGCPLIFGSRTGAGGTLTNTYGYAGGEEDLIHRGAIPAGILSPRKARMLAYVLTSAGATIEQIRAAFLARNE